MVYVKGLFVIGILAIMLQPVTLNHLCQKYNINAEKVNVIGRMSQVACNIFLVVDLICLNGYATLLNQVNDTVTLLMCVWL